MINRHSHDDMLASVKGEMSELGRLLKMVSVYGEILWCGYKSLDINYAVPPILTMVCMHIFQ